MKLIWVVKAEYLIGYEIKLEFNNATIGVVDLQASLLGPIFEALKDINYFKNFKLNTWTIEWPNGADFSPEYLYELTNKTQLEVVNK